MRNPIFVVARDQASIPSMNRNVPKKIVNVERKKERMLFVCKWNFSEKHTFFVDRLKRLLVLQILEVTVYQENALPTFHWQSETVEIPYPPLLPSDQHPPCLLS